MPRVYPKVTRYVTSPQVTASRFTGPATDHALSRKTAPRFGPGRKIFQGGVNGEHDHCSRDSLAVFVQVSGLRMVDG
jgi:hypothetical protein